MAFDDASSGNKVWRSGKGKERGLERGFLLLRRDAGIMGIRVRQARHTSSRVQVRISKTRPEQKTPSLTRQRNDDLGIGRAKLSERPSLLAVLSLCLCTVPMSHGPVIRHLSHRHAQAHLIPTKPNPAPLQHCAAQVPKYPLVPRPSNVQASQAFSRRVWASATAWRCAVLESPPLGACPERSRSSEHQRNRKRRSDLRAALCDMPHRKPHVLIFSCPRNCSGAQTPQRT